MVQQFYGLGGNDTFYLTSIVNFIDGGSGFDNINMSFSSNGIYLNTSNYTIIYGN